MHYLIANALDLHGYDDFAIDVSNYNDISELYLISDALVTDYSSVMFDFGILKRPQFFFAYDIEKYDKGLRGFYMDYMNDLPGEIITDEFKLAEELKQIDQHKVKYQDKIESFYNDFCSIEMEKHLNILVIIFIKILRKIIIKLKVESTRAVNLTGSTSNRTDESKY